MRNVALVVEDNPDLRFAIKATVECAGFVVVAGSLSDISKLVRDRRLLGDKNTLRLVAVVAEVYAAYDFNGITLIHTISEIYGDGFKPVLIAPDTDYASIHKANSAGLSLLQMPFRFEELLKAVGPCENSVAAALPLMVSPCPSRRPLPSVRTRRRPLSRRVPDNTAHGTTEKVPLDAFMARPEPQEALIGRRWRFRTALRPC